MLYDKGFITGLPALIKNRLIADVQPGVDRIQPDWLDFTAYLGNDPDITKSEKDNLQNSYSWQDRIILIAEDEDANFLFLKAAISRTGAGIIRAKNGREAVEIIRNTQHIDLVLMDIKMPVMNGIDATKVIKSLKSSVTVIAQTAYANEKDRKIYLNAGCDDFLAKPFTRERLLKTISQYL